ncbi:unnamed protein product, partial [Rotaria sp. Silwood2]
LLTGHPICVLNGIRMHLESTLDYIRRHGQLIGQLIIQRIHLFSQSNQLQFDTYDKNHSEVQMLTKLAKISKTLNDRHWSDDENEEITLKKGQFKFLSDERFFRTH